MAFAPKVQCWALFCQWFWMCPWMKLRSLWWDSISMQILWMFIQNPMGGIPISCARKKCFGLHGSRLSNWMWIICLEGLRSIQMISELRTSFQLYLTEFLSDALKHAVKITRFSIRFSACRPRTQSNKVEMECVARISFIWILNAPNL